MTSNDWDGWELDLRDGRDLEWGDVSPGIGALITIWSWTLGIVGALFFLAIVATIVY